MKTVEAFPAMWYKCPGCGDENTIRYCLTEDREPDSVCRGCGTRWTFEEMARESFRVKGFRPFPNKYFRAATEFICDECGRTNLVINPIRRQSIEAVEDTDEGVPQMMALQEIDEVENATCKYCGEKYDLEFDLPPEDAADE